ncbi:asb062 [Agrotis segetum nucleopolyhedrovirus B]|uniref:Asb062 n=1 Tax=Agrotis segetum nucleopolyhedrovirus B TaxID=1580580 RepID=A0A0A7KR51_9ABAC|nr:asb062 [Agrotis segetum nucleopolyhedrovirus B]AIZ48619.1 asb062 [Agrotis segetum nucleopolyhedrovirus B]
MRRNNRFFEIGTASSVLNQDQLEQIVSRNRTFLRDFLLVICCVVVFVIVIVFILLIININRTMELAAAAETAARISRQQTFLANLDLRTRSPTRVIDLNRPLAADAAAATTTTTSAAPKT